MISYNNGKIYKLEPVNGDEGDIYIGSTTKKHLCQRMASHKCMYKRWKDGKESKVLSYELFDKYGIENVNIVLLEKVENATTKDELLAVEAKYIKTNACINKVVPLRSIKEWGKDNKDKLDEYRKQYYLDNKEKISEQRKTYATNNSEKIQEYKKLYRLNNKEKLTEYKNTNIYTCVLCKQCLTEQNKNRHEKTKKHLKNLTNNIEV